MLAVTVRRSSWLRGKSPEGSYLRDHNAQQCCLGFVCRAVGWEEDELLGIDTPAAVRRVASINALDAVPDELRGLFDMYKSSTVLDSLVSAEMMNLNDSDKVDDQTRERELTWLAKTIGIELNFED